MRALIRNYIKALIKTGCFATTFDAQAHCIKGSAKTGVFCFKL